MTLQTLFKLKENKTTMKNELFAGLILFLISFASIQICADLLKSCFDANNSNMILPVLLFMIPLLAGTLTMLSGIFYNVPYAVLPNLLITILISVYGRTSLGYDFRYVLVSALIGCLSYYVFTFWIKDKNWKEWIPKSISNVFPFVLGCIFVFFGLFRSGILNSVNSPEPATALGDLLPQIQIQMPIYLGYILNPISVLVLLGIILYIVFQKKYPKNIVLFVFLLISLLGFFLSIKWGSPIKGNITTFQAFGPVGLRKEGFSLLFTNLVTSHGITVNTWVSFFRILKSSTGLLKLSFIFFITLFFQNFFVLNSLENLSNPKTKAPTNPEKKNSKETPIITKDESCSPVKLTKFSSITSLFGILFNTTAFSYAQESAVLIFTEAKTGLTAFFCGLLLLFTAFLSPIGIFTSQAGTPLLFILVGITICASQLKNISVEKVVDWIPFLLFLLITIITMNPVEGLVVSILLYGLIHMISKYTDGTDNLKLSKAFWVTFFISLLYILSQIKIE